MLTFDDSTPFLAFRIGYHQDVKTIQPDPDYCLFYAVEIPVRIEARRQHDIRGTWNFEIRCLKEPEKFASDVLAMMQDCNDVSVNVEDDNIGVAGDEVVAVIDHDIETMHNNTVSAAAAPPTLLFIIIFLVPLNLVLFAKFADMDEPVGLFDAWYYLFLFAFLFRIPCTCFFQATKWYLTKTATRDSYPQRRSMLFEDYLYHGFKPGTMKQNRGDEEHESKIPFEEIMWIEILRGYHNNIVRIGIRDPYRYALGDNGIRDVFIPYLCDPEQFKANLLELVMT